MDSFPVRKLLKLLIRYSSFSLFSESFILDRMFVDGGFEPSSASDCVAICYLPNIVDPSRFHDLSDGTLLDIGDPDEDP